MADIPPVSESEQLLDALRQCDDQLNLWIGKSRANACLLLENPAAARQAAIQAANAGLDLDVMLELEAVLTGLAHKLDLAVRGRPKINLCEAS